MQPSKQNSLPPQLSSRKTPVRGTPRGANGSAHRHRSASLQRSGSAKPKNTPKDNTVTPHLGKRKRGSNQVQQENDEEEDELSPNHEDLVRSIEKSRRVVGTVSPIHEEFDEAPDELSVLENGVSTARKTVVNTLATTNGTPISALARKELSSGRASARTSIAGSTSKSILASRHSSRRSKSTELGPETPSLLPNGHSRVSLASRSEPGSTLNTTHTAVNAEESEDELSPAKVNETTPRIISSERRPQGHLPVEEDTGIDELSSMQTTSAQATPIVVGNQRITKKQQKPEEESTAIQPKKRGRPRKSVVEEEQDDASPPIKPAKRGRPKKSALEKEADVTTPAVSKRKRNVAEQTVDNELDNDQIDELSPDKDRPRTPGERETPIIISDEEGSDEYEEPEPEEETVAPQSPARPSSPKRKKQPKSSSEQPPRKRHKFLGPKHAISVMRIKGSAVRGITVADTTRTILEESIDHRINRMAERLQASQDSSQRKELRSDINLSLAFKESLNEKLLDLQDANDVLGTNMKKMKLFKRDNAELRKNILTLQNSRQDIALQHDDVQMEFEAEKAKVDARNELSANMYDIEAAIANGRKRAREEGREDEGPEIPVSMLLDMVGRDVGSLGGGLLSKVKAFNSTLERAAGWLEGRV